MYKKLTERVTMVQKGNEIHITGEYITLGQLLKFLDLVYTGGEEKLYLSTHEVLFNGEAENRRGKKLRVGDSVTVEGKTYLICMSSD